MRWRRERWRGAILEEEEKRKIRGDGKQVKKRTRGGMRWIRMGGEEQYWRKKRRTGDFY